MRAEQTDMVSSSGPSTTVDEVVRLVGLFYSMNPKDPAQQAEANARLIEIQSSPDVWSICWQLLDPNICSTQEVQFFAANTIVLKINKNWSQLPQTWVKDELRPKLFEVLCSYTSSMTGYKLVTDRLALALATLAVHSIPSFWPDAIEHIMHALMPANLPTDIPSKRICDILLKILLYIPEEYSVLIPHQDDRAKLNQNMTQAGPIVFKFLYSLLVAPTDNEAVSPMNLQSVLKCITSWTLHSQTSLLELDISKPLLDVIYELIQDEEYCSGACAVVAATFSTQKSENYRNTVIDFIPKIARLKSIIDQYKSNDDMECAIKVYSLVINFAENHSRLFLKIVLNHEVAIRPEIQGPLKRDVLEIIRIILECSAAPGIFGIDEKYSDMTFAFWLTFLENFYYYLDSFGDIICETFDPLIDALLSISLQKLQYPDLKTYQNEWSSDQRESFRCYRQDLGDNISLIIHFPRARERILAKLHTEFQNELRQMIQGEPINGDRRWQGFESVIFALKSVAEAIPFDESKHLPDILNTLSQVPFNESHALIYCTVAEMVSAYSDWLYAHRPHLGSAFGILFKGVLSNSHEMRLFSTLSLKDLTTECQSVLHPFAIEIVKSCSEAILRPDMNLTTCEKSRLIHAMGTSLPMCPPESISLSLNAVAAPLISDLESAMSQSDPKFDELRRPIVLDRLTMMNSLIESFHLKQYSGNDYEADGDENDYRLDPNRFEVSHEVDITQSALNLVRQYVPILVKISDKYRADEQIIGIVSNTIKRCAKSLGTDMKEILKEILTVIVNSYDPLLNPHLIEGFLPLYMLFRNDPATHDILRDAFQTISDLTLKACVGNPLQQLSITIENYFKLACIICKRFTDFYTSEKFLVSVEYIYKLAVASLELPEKRTLSEVCSFLQQFRIKSTGIDSLHRIFLNNLDMMLYNIFNVMGGTYSTPRNAVEHVIDLFYAIMDAEEIREPLKMIVQKENFPTSYVSSDQKSRFIQRIVHEKNRRKFKDICTEFVLLSRNLHRQ